MDPQGRHRHLRRRALLGSRPFYAVAPDGTVYVGTDRGRVLVISREGELVRQLQVNGPIRGSIATTASSEIVVPCEDGSLYAFNAQGKPLWTSTQTISIDSSPAIGPRGAGGRYGDMASVTSMVGNHSVSALVVHVVWATRARASALPPSADDWLAAELRRKATELGADPLLTYVANQRAHHGTDATPAQGRPHGL